MTDAQSDRGTLKTDPLAARLDYAVRGRTEVEGWLELEDALLFHAIDEAQQAAGVKGDVLEIGAYKGRSAILLGYFPTQGERFLVCDPFESSVQDAENRAENQRHYSGLGRDQFLANYRRFHNEGPVLLSHESARLLEREDLRKRFRLLHIDGSHRYQGVATDIEVSRRLLGEGGVVVFDDAVNRKELGVAAAVWEAVFGQGLQPFASTGKIYATWGEGPVNATEILEFADRRPELVVEKDEEVAGFRVPFVRSIPPRRPRLIAIRQELVPPLFSRFSPRSRGRRSGHGHGE